MLRVASLLKSLQGQNIIVTLKTQMKFSTTLYIQKDRSKYFLGNMVLEILKTMLSRFERTQQEQ